MQQNFVKEATGNSRSYYRKWILFAPVGLLLIGAGMCVFGTALFKMHSNAAFTDWFVWGTGSLILINGGVCFFGSAIKYSILYALARHRKEA
jgi:hypothetical protein